MTTSLVRYNTPELIILCNHERMISFHNDFFRHHPGSHPASQSPSSWRVHEHHGPWLVPPSSPAVSVITSGLKDQSNTQCTMHNAQPNRTRKESKHLSHRAIPPASLLVVRTRILTMVCSLSKVLPPSRSPSCQLTDSISFKCCCIIVEGRGASQRPRRWRVLEDSEHPWGQRRARGQLGAPKIRPLVRHPSKR